MWPNSCTAGRCGLGPPLSVGSKDLLVVSILPLNMPPRIGSLVELPLKASTFFTVRFQWLCSVLPMPSLATMVTITPTSLKGRLVQAVLMRYCSPHAFEQTSLKSSMNFVLSAAVQVSAAPPVDALPSSNEKLQITVTSRTPRPAPPSS